MQEHNLELIKGTSLPSHTVRDWVAPFFRRRRFMGLSFVLVFGIAALVSWMIPARYQAEVKILVNRERADTLVNPDPNTPAATASLTEEDLNSEVELLKSRDLLGQVVVACGLNAPGNRSFLRSIATFVEGRSGKPISEEQRRTLEAVRTLEKNLSVEPLKKTKLIVISYESTDPDLPAKVLQTLVRLYLEKHVAVHRVPGAVAFFQNQTEQYRRQLLDAQHRAAGFGGRDGVVAAAMEKEITVRKLNDFDGELQKTRAVIAETEQRIVALQALEASTPDRLTTQVRTLDSPILLQQLKSTLLNLELKRSELLSKFTPDYRLVQDIDVQIAQTRQALENEQSHPLHEQTTDRDATHEWIRSELAKARAERDGLRAQAKTTAETLTTYRSRARQLNQSEIVQEDLIRAAKLAEDNFLLYSRKQEEARIQDALDQRRIINVSVAEEATVPALPASSHRVLGVALGGLLACLVSLGLGYALDYTDSTFRTPQEVELFLNAQVLAALPKN
jgi:uncharacterized protein involved in exopolysaccharide biosynthesis